MRAPAVEAWLGDEAVPPAALAALWALMALEGSCLRPASPMPGQRRARRRHAHPRAPRDDLSCLTTALLTRTHLHGLRHICSRSNSLSRRAIWMLAFCTCLGLLLSWSSNRLLHWLAFPTHTRVHTEWARELAFPTVTICNNNPIRLYHLTKSDLYFAGHWLGLLLANRTARPLVLDLLQDDRRAWFSKLSDFRLFLPPRHFEGTSLEFMDRMGHQLEDMLLACKYRGEPCGAHNFSTVSLKKWTPPLFLSFCLCLFLCHLLPLVFVRFTVIYSFMQHMYRLGSDLSLVLVLCCPLSHVSNIWTSRTQFMKPIHFFFLREPHV